MEWKTQENDYDSIIKQLDTESIYSRLSLLTGESINKLKKDIDAEEIGCILSSILTTNKTVSKDNINCFINNVSGAFISPYDLQNAREAAEKIFKHISKEDSIVYIYADYDSDGIFSGSLLKQGLDEHSSGKVIVRFPNREDGYGINKDFCNAIIEAHKNDAKNVLVVTVDNGITKVEEVDMLLKAGMDVIITDHHNSDKELGVPNCIIVNPHNAYEKQDERTKCYCGATVAFKVLQIIKERFNNYDLMKYVPYVATATVTDMMPLSTENNAFIQYALEMLNREDTCPEFFRLFKEATDIDVFTTEQMAWTLGPALNATGRLGQTEVGATALLNPTEENVLAILNINNERKSITDKFKASVKKLKYEGKVIVHIADSAECPKGTIGILAGKLAEHFKRPAIALLNHNGICHGSIRSVDGINMYKIMEEFKEAGLIISYGGHAEACVCDFKVENLDKIKSAFNNLNLMTYTKSAIDSAKTISLDITLAHLNKSVYALISMLTMNKSKPPIFVINDLTVQSVALSQKNPSNIKLTVKSKGCGSRTMWAWGQAEKINEIIEKYGTISLIGSIKKNFMGYGYILDIMDAY